jgi:hypothetical protein
MAIFFFIALTLVLIGWALKPVLPFISLFLMVYFAIGYFFLWETSDERDARLLATIPAELRHDPEFCRGREYLRLTLTNTGQTTLHQVSLDIEGSHDGRILLSRPYSMFLYFDRLPPSGRPMTRCLRIVDNQRSPYRSEVEGMPLEEMDWRVVGITARER